MKIIKIKSINANVGIIIAYRKGLKKLISEMHREYQDAVKEHYSKPIVKVNQNIQVIAQDSSPAELNKQLNSLKSKWQRKFDLACTLLASKAINDTLNYTDLALSARFKSKKLLIKPRKISSEIKKLAAVITKQNVSLIKSIPAQYHTNIESAISAGYSAGQDLSKIYQAVNRYKGITDRRARMIVNDQMRKVTASFERTRQLELGIDRAIWRHTHRKETSRPSHVKADGTEYELTKGCLIDGEYIQVGQLINCQCTAEIILPFYEE